MLAQGEACPEAQAAKVYAEQPVPVVVPQGKLAQAGPLIKSRLADFGFGPAKKALGRAWPQPQPQLG